jgi:L-asparaginase II
MQSELLLQIKRGKITEREHFGSLVLVDKNTKILAKIGNNTDAYLFLRSCAKPIQALPVFTSGAFKKFNLNLAELAIICSSHSASNEHISLVKNILNKIGLSKKHLQCGIHEPFDTDTKNYLIKQNIKPQNIHNNCSGKHAGMLAACKAMNWDINDYLNFDHPLQKEYIKTIKNLFNIENIELALDGCGAPVHGIPFDKMGTGLLNLFLNPDNKLIKEAFIKNPLIIGGKGKLDSVLIKASNGNLLAKNGAEGLIIIVNILEEKALTIKIQDANISARNIVTINALKQLGWLTEKELKTSDILNLYNLEIKNLHNTIVGEIIPQFTL